MGRHYGGCPKVRPTGPGSLTDRGLKIEKGRRHVIYEIRTYTLKAASIGPYEAGFAEGLPTREKYSKLAGFWHTEIGPLNQVIHIWPYEDLKHRTEVRTEAMSDPSGKWPPKTGDLVMGMQSEIVVPAPFMRPLAGEPQALGSVYELRMYTYRPGSMQKVLDSWTESVPAREALSPLALAGFSELGTLNRWFHLWPYKDLNDRARIREEATKDPKYKWPPRTAEWLVSMENKVLQPAAFSALH